MLRELLGDGCIESVRFRSIAVAGTKVNEANNFKLYRKASAIKEKYKEEPFHFFRNFSPEDYACVLNNAVCTVGNSSSFIREGAFLGVPAVIVGDRQKNREAGVNIKIVDYSAENIINAIHAQIVTGRYPKSTLFGTGDSGKRIVSKLSEILLRMETLCIK